MRSIVWTDGGARGNPGPAAIGGVVQDAQQNPVYEFSQYIGEGTNNEAEYKAIVAVLEWLVAQHAATNISEVEFRLDSMLVVQQLNRAWKIKEQRLQQLAEKCWMLLRELTLPYKILHIPREKNKRADQLVNQALDAALK